jgi:hypothetical protein
MALLTNKEFRPVVAPSLPNATLEYSQQYEDQYSNVLRLYFNQLDNFTRALTGSTGGSLIKFPHIGASDTTDQYATGNNTATLIAWNTEESILGFTLVSGAAIAEYSGVYKITYSLQFANTDNAIQDAVVWLKVNNVDVARSATDFSVPARKSAGVPSYVCGYSEAMFSVNAGDSIKLYWATGLAATSGGVNGIYIFADPLQTTPYARPAIPSAIGSITFVSAL